MPKATVTVRELKNKETGIDLSVPSYREIPGLMRSTFEYQVVVVSSLSCFKLPSHKDTDVVQFTLYKKFPEFEELRAKLNENFSGWALPPLLKKSIIVNEGVIKERRTNLDAFFKFICATPRIVTSSPVLVFLGVDAAKAKRFAAGETDTTSHDKGDNTETTEGEDKQEGISGSSLFDDDDDDDDEDTEDFLSTAVSAAATGDDDDDLFSSDVQSSLTNNTRLFERQDLQRELTEEDEKDFAFVPDAIVTKTDVVQVDEDNGNDDLLNIDEDVDLEKLLTLETTPTQQQQQQQSPSSSSTSQEKPSPAKPQPSPKPSIAAKPKPSPKPALAEKSGLKPDLGEKPGPKPVPREKPGPKPTPRDKPSPKPSVGEKPSLKPGVAAKPLQNSQPDPESVAKQNRPASTSQDSEYETNTVVGKPGPASPQGTEFKSSSSHGKPPPPQRPKPAPRSVKPGAKKGGSGEGEKKEVEESNGDAGKRDGVKESGDGTPAPTTKPDMSSEDIMQYIAASVEEGDADLDLFS